MSDPDPLTLYPSTQTFSRAAAAAGGSWRETGVGRMRAFPCTPIDEEFVSWKWACSGRVGPDMRPSADAERQPLVLRHERDGRVVELLVEAVEMQFRTGTCSGRRASGFLHARVLSRTNGALRARRRRPRSTADAARVDRMLSGGAHAEDVFI